MHDLLEICCKICSFASFILYRESSGVPSGNKRACPRPMTSIYRIVGTTTAAKDIELYSALDLYPSQIQLQKLWSSYVIGVTYVIL